jgi:hypothetical protein
MDRRNAMPEPKAQYSPLSVHGTFVVHFRLSTDVAHNELAGRIEHIASGQLAHFTSLEELLAFIGRILVSVSAAPLEET